MSTKAYQCDECGREEEIDTNHWGECYPFCKTCERQTTWRPSEEIPDGAWTPEPWKKVTITKIINPENN